MANDPEVRDAVKEAKSALGFAGRVSITVADLAYALKEAVNTLGSKYLRLTSSSRQKSVEKRAKEETRATTRRTPDATNKTPPV